MMEMKIVRSISVLYGQVLITLSSCLLIANAFSSVATAYVSRFPAINSSNL